MELVKPQEGFGHFRVRAKLNFCGHGLGNVWVLGRLGRRMNPNTSLPFRWDSQSSSQPTALAENAIRPFAVGRKAWLFADTPQGATASATCFSLVETAKANGLEPYNYLYILLSKLPYAETVEQIEALLPGTWVKNKPPNLSAQYAEY